MKKDLQVLVAEDDDDDFFLVSRELAKAGLRCVSRVADGKSVLAYLEGRDGYRNRVKHPFPDLLFLDLKLPEMLGHDVLAAIRRRPQWKALKVYVLTGSDEQRDRDQITAIGGADGYFVKPLMAPQVTALFVPES